MCVHTVKYVAIGARSRFLRLCVRFLCLVLCQAGTAATNGLIYLRKATGPKDPSPSEAPEHAEPEVPILQTSVAYGVYMAISSNLRCAIPGCYSDTARPLCSDTAQPLCRDTAWSVHSDTAEKWWCSLRRLHVRF